MVQLWVCQVWWAGPRAESSALLGPWTGASTSVEPAASYWELGWSLAQRASSRSGLAPCAWPVWAEASFLADCVAFAKHLNTPRLLGVIL